VLVGKVGRDFALVASGPETGSDARPGGLVMFAIGSGLDELRFVDDAIDVAVLSSEVEEGFERSALAVESIRRIGECRRDMIAHLGGHVTDNFPEDDLL